VLQDHAEKLLNLRQGAHQALLELRELQQGKLSIAANEFTALYLLPVLAEFRRLHPMIKIAVQRTLGRNIPEDVLRHNCELGVLTYDPQIPQLRSAVVYQDELVLVVPPNHPLAGEPQVSIQQLGAESFVAHNVSSPYREKVIEAFKRHKTPLHMDIELPRFRPSKILWQQETASRFFRDQRRERTSARRTQAHPSKRVAPASQTTIGYRKAASISHAARAFLKVAENIASERRGRYRFEPQH
jgi:DNA-binding transcriptional LysR family regulator